MSKNESVSKPSHLPPYYPTRHIFCAAYLLTLGHAIVRIESQTGTKSTIYFSGDGADQDAMAFFNGTAKKVNPKGLSDSYRHIKDLLFNNK